MFWCVNDYFFFSYGNGCVGIIVVVFGNGRCGVGVVYEVKIVGGEWKCKCF